MGSIETTIIVDVEGIGSVEALAAAANDLDAAWDRLEGSLAKGLDVGGSAAGFDKMAASADAAFAKMQADADKFMESMSKLGDMGSVGDAGAASLGKLDDSLKGAAEQADALTVSVGKADDTLKGLGGSADASAAGLGKLSDAQKSVAETGAGLRDTSAGVSDGLKVQADQTAALTALQADMADSQKALTALSAEHAAVMADSNAKIAAGQRLNSAAYKVASEDAVAAQKTQSAAAAQSAADAEAGAKKYHMLALGGAAALAYGVDLAAKLQTSVTRLYTTAGESQANLPMMTAGILALSGQTNTSQAQLGQGAYMVESAGYHGKDALGVLKAAAEGAQAEGAPLGDTANALTSLMNAYGVPKGTTASKAAMSDMDQIIAMVSRGKMTMAGAVGALPDVLPAASAAKLSFADVGGALATMTSLGVSPDRGAQNLSHVITSLMNPNAVQTKEQQQLGLNPVQLQNDLGKQGLTGTLTELSSTVMHSMGPAGDVLFKTFSQSKSAAADAQTMINAMPPAIRGVAQAYADGKTTVAQWNAEMFKGSESSVQKNMLQQFATTENQAKGFNELLKTGAPDVQTYAAAMDKLLGGQTGLNVAMELTGQHMPVMKANTDAIAASAQHAGANVSGWSQVQGTLNFQIGSFTKSLEAVATEAGQVALPAITDTLKVASAAGSFLADHPALTKDVLTAGGILGAAAIAPKLVSTGATALSSIGKVAETLHIPGLDKLANIGSGTGMSGAAASLSGAGASLDGAAASLEGAAAALKGGAAAGAAGGEAAGTAAAGAGGAEAEAATAAEGAGAGGVFAKIAGKGGPLAGISAAAGPVGWGIALGEIIKGVGDTLSPAGTQAGKYNRALQTTPATNDSSLMPSIFGGFEGKLMQDIGLPVGALLTGKPLPAAATAFGGGRAAATGDRYYVPPPPPPPAAESPDMLAVGGHAGTAGTSPPGTTGAMSRDVLSWAGHAGTATAKVGVTVDTSSITAAKGKIAADLAALSTSQGMKPAKVPAPDLSALASAKGPATAAGASVGTGFASGIAAGAGAVSAAAHSLAAAAVAALTMHLQSSSPSKVTHAIGQDGFDAGFAGGISDGQGAAIAATAALGTSSVSTLVQSLEGGSTSLQNALTALYGPLADSQAVTTIAQEIATLQAAHPADSKWLGKQGAKLEQLANQAGALEQQISGAQQIATSVIGGASVMSASGYTAAVPTAGGPQSAQSILSGTALQVSDTKQFAKELAQAQKEGLNATTLSEIAQAGVTAGLPVLQGLLQGGPGTVKQMNALESQLIKAGGQIGNVGGPAGYQATLAADAAAGAQLKSELSMVGKEMSKVANEVSKATGGTKSTSATSAGTTSTGAAAASVTALASGGKSAAGSLDAVNGAAHGAAGGLNSVDSAAHAAASALAALAGAAGGSSSGSGSGTGASAGTGTGLMPRTGGGGGGAQAQGGGFTPGFHGISGYGQAPPTQVTHVHNWNIQGSLLSQQDLYTHVQQAALAFGSNNWQQGFNYPGRSN